ncbi:copper-resistant cuproprotein CopI [Vibrio viridaestus]|uniref:Copper-binding protein n=1 Tax=Vibrio viridaestus TaxID=2487322 RepID=A0A3N9U3M0_9VIBR|nr:cupredoxin family protein [Vibrio viridaestus]RQW62626.1 copper-binding protein [Vibrio viridaestus]
MKKLLITLMLTAASSAYADTNHSHADMNMDTAKMDHSGMSMEATSAVGMPAMGSKPDKVVHVMLTDDMKINFKKDVEIKSNDVVQFVVMNIGKMKHEFVIGSPEEQAEHREMMKTMSGHDHDSGNSVTVEPGKAKQILWHFHGDKTVELSCNIPGHYEAGMTKTLQL